MIGGKQTVTKGISVQHINESKTSPFFDQRIMIRLEKKERLRCRDYDMALGDKYSVEIFPEKKCMNTGWVRSACVPWVSGSRRPEEGCQPEMVLFQAILLALIKSFSWQQNVHAY